MGLWMYINTHLHLLMVGTHHLHLLMAADTRLLWLLVVGTRLHRLMGELMFLHLDMVLIRDGHTHWVMDIQPYSIQMFRVIPGS